mgnify:CR=1 FL=1
MWKQYIFAGGFTNGSERKMRPSGRKRGIAAYKMANVASALRKLGADVESS